MRALVCALSLVSCLVGPLSAQEEITPPPAVQKLLTGLERPVDGSWKNQPVSQILTELAASNQVSLSLDPAAASLGSRLVSFQVAAQPLQAVLEQLTERNGLEYRLMENGTIRIVPNRQANPIPEWVTDPQPVRIFSPGRGRRQPPPGGWADPVKPLGEPDAAALAKPTPVVWKAVLDGYVDRIEAWATTAGTPTPELLAFFKAHSDLRREFWRAIDPRFDQVAAACGILDELRRRDEKKLLQFHHLAIALAVVYDSPEAAPSSRYNLLWAVQESQFGQTLTWQEIWGYFTDPRNQGMFVFKPDKLAWPLLTDLVDLDVDQGEIDWVRKEYGNSRIDLQALYSQVPYDYQKLAMASTRSQSISTKLGTRPYTLANLRTYGGVCVDQAHFSSRVAKLFGVPAVKCRGEGRYGGIGHAWTGYLGAKKGAPQLIFTGRYQFDFYYLGTAFDPQTRTEMLDRDVELMYAGVSGGHYEAYSDAALLARAGRSLIGSEPALATTLAKEAVRRNPFVGEAWKVLLAAVPETELAKTWQTLARTLTEHPDTVWAGLRIVLDRLPGEPKARQPLFEQCYTVCGQAKRPDLQIQVRLLQTTELAAAKQDKEVITLAFETVRANVKEGTLIMPLVKQVVVLANRFAAENPGFRMGLVKDTFAKLEQDFPKTRGNEVAPAWTEWQELVRSLK